ncbi:hypothetical protein HDU81_005880 [Chytriomyces hyalinus]|nr:hypothetical protein HDU81_005880 [Chytriomyces hyalinus]
MEITAPAGSGVFFSPQYVLVFSIAWTDHCNPDFNITLTQWIPSTNTRGIDSKYRLLSSYITPNGKPQTLRIMWQDYSTNLLGQPFDLTNLKDLTLVNLAPIGAVFTFTKLTLLGTCSNSPDAGTGGTATGFTATGAPVATAGSVGTGSGSSSGGPSSAGAAAKSGSGRNDFGLLAMLYAAFYLL